MRTSQYKPFTITTKTKLISLSTTMVLLPLVAFLTLALTPTLTPESTSATSEISEMAVGVDEVLSLRIVKQNSSTGEWDIDTDTVSTRVSHGNFASAMVKVIASTNGRGGYQLSMNDTDSNNKLVSSAILDEIPALASSVTIDNITDTTGKFTAGRWGYSWAKNNGDNPSLTFNSMPIVETQMDNTNDLGTNIYNFTLGVRVEDTTPATTYTDQVMFSLVGNVSPSAPAFFTREYMQQFTPQVCNSVKTPLASTTEVTADNGGDYMYSGDHATKVPSTTIKDQRDEQTYTIRKLADGNCWMTSNLRLGKLGAVALDSSNSNMASEHTFTLNAAVPPANAGSWTNQEEKNIAIYRNENEPLDNKGNTGDPLNTVLYNWYTATAGALDSNGNSLMTAAGGNQAVDSVCPKNWQLPVNEGSAGTGKSFSHLVRTYTGNGSNRDGNTTGQTTATVQADLAKLHAAPTSFVYSGYYHYGGTLNSRSFGLWWSSTVYSAAGSYSLRLDNYNSPYYVYPQDSSNKGYAFAVRCVVAS